VTGHSQADLAGTDPALRRFDADDSFAVVHKAGHLAVLDDVNAVGVRSAGIAPGNGVMPCRAGAALEDGAMDGEAGRFGEIEIRHQPPNLGAIEHVGIDAVQPHDVGSVAEDVELVGRMGSYKLATLRNITLKFSARDMPSHSFIENS
jgi:hypothetical protein